MNEGIPSTPVHQGATDTGFSCMTGLKKEGPRYILSSGKGLVLFPILMFMVAIAMCFIPWQANTDIGIKFKYIIAIGFAWGGLCALAAFYFKRAFGKSVVLDTTSGTIRIYKGKKISRTLPLKDLVGWQLCFQDHGRYKSYELNLCVRREGELFRDCILAYCGERYVRKVAKRLSQYTGKEIFDCIETNKSNPSPG